MDLGKTFQGKSMLTVHSRLLLRVDAPDPRDQENNVLGEKGAHSVQ